MEKKKVSNFLIFIFFIILLTSFVLADLIPSTSPCWVRGTIELEGNTEDVDGLVLSASVEGTEQKTVNLDETGDFDFNSLAGNTGDEVILKLCGLYDDADENMVFSFSEFCQSGENQPWVLKNIDFSKKADGAVGCTCDEVCSGGTCVNPGTEGVCSSEDYYCDDDGDCESELGETSSNCPDDCDSSGGGGGSSTRSGGAFPRSDSVQDTGFSFLKNYATLSSGANNVQITNNSLFITEILFTTKDESKNVKFSLTKKENVTNKYVGAKVYGYVEIVHINLQDSNILNAKIKFKVDKLWLMSNSVLKENIVLLRYNSIMNQWNELNTIVIDEDMDQVYFEASSPGLSLFAISVIKTEEQEPLLPIENIQDVQNEDTQSIGENSDEEEPARKFIFKPFYIFIILGVLLVILISVFVHFNNKSGATKQSNQAQNPTQQTMESKLEEWILKAESKGYAPEQIKEFLLKKGYKYDDVVEALRKTSKK